MSSDNPANVEHAFIGSEETLSLFLANAPREVTLEQIADHLDRIEDILCQIYGQTLQLAETLENRLPKS